MRTTIASSVSVDSAMTGSGVDGAMVASGVEGGCGSAAFTVCIVRDTFLVLLVDNSRSYLASTNVVALFAPLFFSLYTRVMTPVNERFFFSDLNLREHSCSAMMRHAGALTVDPAILRRSIVLGIAPLSTRKK